MIQRVKVLWIQWIHVVEDDRKNIKLSPDVKAKFDEQKPDGMTQSEFIDALLEDTEIQTGISVEDIRRVVRDEMESVLSGFRR